MGVRVVQRWKDGAMIMDHPPIAAYKDGVYGRHQVDGNILTSAWEPYEISEPT